MDTNNNFTNFIKKNNIHKSWHMFFIKNYDIIKTIQEELNNYQNVLPPIENIYKVFTTNRNKIKVLLLGQDPYHTPGVAMGLSFSVHKNIKIPPSLVNIFKEINNEYPNKYKFIHGDLSNWFLRENIFLLNCALTVIKNKPSSHMKLWKIFTENLIKYLAIKKNIIFLLLGNFAKQYKIFLDNNIIIESTHPSPLSARNGFFNSNIFKKVDQQLINLGKTPINWQN